MRHVHFAEIDSTNSYLKARFEELEDLTFLSASFQTAGKGREERNWKASKDENLLFSCLIKNGPMLACGPFLSLVAAVAVTKALEEYGVHACIKWPNDVYVDGKKIAGILLEGVGSQCLVIGIGINVNQTDFEGEYRVPPTSIAIELGNAIDLDAFRDTVFTILEESLRTCANRRAFLAYYQERDYLRGKKVSYSGEEYVAQGVDERFALLLGKDNETIPVISGEISLL